jgi:hypothetical protein
MRPVEYLKIQAEHCPSKGSPRVGAPPPDSLSFLQQLHSATVSENKQPQESARLPAARFDSATQNGKTGVQIVDSSHLHQGSTDLNNAYAIIFFENNMTRVQRIVLSKIHQQRKPTTKLYLVDF